MDQQEDKINDATTWQTLQTKTVRRQCRRANARPTGFISTASQENDRPQKQKKLWNFIKSIRKEATGIAPLKGNGRLFNSPYDKANILNRQYQAQFTREDPGSEVLLLTVIPIHRWLEEATPEEQSQQNSRS